MLSVGSRSVFALVVGGETLDEVLPGRGNESARSLTAELVDPGAVTDDGFTDPFPERVATVAERLDITQSTFNKHLRIAERKTFGLLFDADA